MRSIGSRPASHGVVRPASACNELHAAPQCVQRGGGGDAGGLGAQHARADRQRDGAARDRRVLFLLGIAACRADQHGHRLWRLAARPSGSGSLARGLSRMRFCVSSWPIQPLKSASGASRARFARRPPRSPPASGPGAFRPARRKGAPRSAAPPAAGSPPHSLTGSHSSASGGGLAPKLTLFRKSCSITYRPRPSSRPRSTSKTAGRSRRTSCCAAACLMSRSPTSTAKAWRRF
jgi:hypothetical protein